jgi:hypothetical protein
MNKVGLLLVLAGSPDYAGCYRLLREVSPKSESEIRAVLEPHLAALRKIEAKCPTYSKPEVALVLFTAWKRRTQDELMLGAVCAACHLFLTEATPPAPPASDAGT